MMRYRALFGEGESPFHWQAWGTFLAANEPPEKALAALAEPYDDTSEEEDSDGNHDDHPSKFMRKFMSATRKLLR
jgi:hypothetical protein